MNKLHASIVMLQIDIVDYHVDMIYLACGVKFNSKNRNSGLNPSKKDNLKPIVNNLNTVPQDVKMFRYWNSEEKNVQILKFFIDLLMELKQIFHWFTQERVDYEAETEQQRQKERMSVRGKWPPGKGDGYIKISNAIFFKSLWHMNRTDLKVTYEF